MEETFCERIKEQLIECVPKNHCCRASMLCGILLCEKKRKNSFSSRVEELVELLRRRDKSSKKKNDLLSGLSQPTGYIADTENKRLADGGIFCNECAAALLRGCFLSGGRSGSPTGSTYLELSMPSEEFCSQVFDILVERGLEPKRTVRRGENIIYFKKADSIEDMLSFMGAIQASFELTNAKIVNDFRRRASSVRNCDTFNINKTVGASVKQLAAIKAIKDAGLMETLPVALRQTASIREAHPSVPIEELIALHPDPITKSGVYHRLTKLVVFAEEKQLID